MLKGIDNIYFLGIGGISMSALARWAQIKGFNVRGWDDNINSSTIDSLNDSGIIIDDSCSEIDFFAFLDSLSKENTILVYTSAISEKHHVLKVFKNKNINAYKRADLLQCISTDYQVVAIAGTHGKTTISVMLSHILKFSGINCNAFFGGVSKNYNSNFIIGDSSIMVVEADEYDRSFLKLKPIFSLVSSLDKDHGDIYSSHEDMLQAYDEFMVNTKQIVIGNNKLNSKFDFTYSQTSSADFYASCISKKKDSLYFTINFPDNLNVNTKLHFGTYYNVENAVAAASLAFILGVSPAFIGQALGVFKGVKRRFEHHDITIPNMVLIDDYAHHPEELKSLIQNSRILYKGKEIFFIFQPHLFSRTLEFEDDFAEALSLVDKLIILDF